MPKVRPISQIAEKWARVTPGRAGDYRSGIEAPKKDWAEEAVRAEDRYKRGVTEAANRGRYGKGVSEAGTGKWKARALAKGPSRFAEGVAIARPDYERGFAPYREVIEATELPPRGPKGDPTNIQRVAAIAAALHNKKVGS
ncbi:MAG: hypothetical protein DRJ03_19370 [Chloroflexi bacterium]|nr:MAG: hypothetical protein DRJ03_19370 [Chloroflexota bacterium]